MTDVVDLESLLAACAKGDRAALRTLYGATSPHLMGVALRIVRQRELAEDVVQEAYVQIWRQAGRFSDRRGSARSWIVSIVRYRAIDALRRGARHRADSDVVDTPVPDSAPGPAAIASDRQDLRRLGTCMTELAPQPRRAIMLAQYEGLRHEDVAVRMNAPLGTVKSWIRRGLIQLRRCIDQ